MGTDQTEIVRIAVIGTAGRKEDQKRLDSGVFELMYEKMASLFWEITEYGKKLSFCVSGGAAWADHLVVHRFLQGYSSGLRIYLPCEGVSNGEFYGSNDAEVMNYYHGLFSEKMARNTIRDIELAINAGAEVVYGNNFKERNLSLASDCDWLVAFTFGPGPSPKIGGTSHAWNNCFLPLERKIHVSIPQLIKKQRKK